MSSSARAAAVIVSAATLPPGRSGPAPGMFMAKRRSSRSAARLAFPAPLSARAASAVRIAAARKSTRGLSGPMIRCSSGQVLTHSRARAGDSKSDVSAGHK
jgi:hypothetical protein